MKIVVDNKIPFIEGAFGELATVISAPGNEIDADMVKDADALIVRTRTMCNASLLRGSSVRFIATATIGYDHIDAEYCEANDIVWANAPGCNADAVVQYVFSALAHLAIKHDFDLTQKVLGVVGVGNVGNRIVRFAKKMGMEVLQNDPPRADHEGAEGFVSLDELKAKSDIITFHTPLTRDGLYPTFHLCDDLFFEELGNSPIIINASRGEVCSAKALTKAKQLGQSSHLVIDCWEDEPHFDRELLKFTDIGTFHIAGYSLEGKANATTASVRSISRFFGLGIDDWSVQLPAKEFSFPKGISPLEEVLQSYPIMNDDQLLRQSPDAFEELRGSYDFRREPDVIL